jgi:hypothetical protein
MLRIDHLTLLTALFGELPDYPAGQVRYFLCERLVPVASTTQA